MPPFIVYALPRSRTAWLSRFLSYGEWHCGHDELRHQRSLEDIASWFRQPLTGTAETAGAPWWRLALKHAPDARVVVVRRPVGDVVDSLCQVGLGFARDALEREMRRLDRKLDQIVKRVPNCLEVQFYDLHSEDTCRAIFEHCLGLPFDHAWWSHWAPQNVQISVPAQYRHYMAYRDQIERLRAQAEVSSRSLIEHSRPLREPEELVLREEPLERFLQDCSQLTKEHTGLVGEHPEAWKTKNWDLMGLLEGVEAHQIVTARSNGRLYGYLMTLIGPCMESPDLKNAYHHIFYASPDFNGLGRQLLRTSEAILREKGVDEIFMRAGTRGDGPRLGSLYKRMGAEPEGQLFRLRLKG